MDVILVLGIALIAGAVGIALGMLAAPAIGRLADRVGRSDDEEEDGDER